MSTDYDVIVVGARCAGSPTAMLLARKGYRVLVVDRATFPSDTLSTHMIHAPGVAALRRWGLLDAVVATGCPPVTTYAIDFGPITISGTPRPSDGVATAYGPRRTVLDKILVDAADGWNSRVAKTVRAEQYHEKPKLQWSYYTYWSGLPLDGFEIFVRPDRGWAAIPTNDDLTLVVLGWPYAEAKEYRADIEGNYLATLDLAPEFAKRVAGATREASFLGTSLPGFLRKPYGPGWVLVGDAGYTKDPITAQGISDAFRDAEVCAAALDDTFQERRTFTEAMSAYQQARDAHVLPIYEFTAQLASLEAPPEELQHLLGAVSGNADAMADFVSITAGTVSPADFFHPDHVGRILSAA